MATYVTLIHKININNKDINWKKEMCAIYMQMNLTDSQEPVRVM